jgi:hypothetical protein
MAKAGRKRTGMKRINAMLDAHTIKGALALGGGNLSLGLRLAVERVYGPNPAHDIYRQQGK